MGDHTGSLSAHLRLRYASDLALQGPLVGLPALSPIDNAILLDLAYVEHHPTPWLTLRAGRHWAWGALGTRDLDGLTLRLAPKTPLAPFAELSLGRDVQLGQGWLAPDTFDVQGLPASNDASSPQALHLQTRAGLAWGQHLTVEAAALRRQSASPDALGPVTRESRVGAALTAQPADSLVLTSAATFNMLLQATERAHLQLAWRAPFADLTASAAVERRRPWFDSASIFNLFGTTPHDTAYLNLALPVDALSTRFDLRAWGRAFHADDDHADLGAGTDDARATGVALAHDTRLPARLILRSQLSAQQAPLDYGGQQYLLDTQLRAPGWLDRMSLSARLITLLAITNHHRQGNELALGATLGADLPVLDHGTLSLFIEHRLSQNLPALTSAQAALTIEVWP
jgi:hypothetical protein